MANLALSSARVKGQPPCCRPCLACQARKKGSTAMQPNPTADAAQQRKRNAKKARAAGYELTEDESDGDAPAQSKAAADTVYASTQQPQVDDGVVDQRVTDRMLKRIFTFAGLPVLLGFLLYPAFYYFKVVQRVDFPMGFVFVTQSIVFGTGLLGITYGATSASWDPDREGSAFGWSEFRANIAAIMGKYGRE